MFRIRRVYDLTAPVNVDAVRQVQAVLQAQFPGLDPAELAALPERLTNPFKRSFQSILFCAADGADQVLGAAIVLHDPTQHFCFLEYLATCPGSGGRGVGGALYERVDEEARALNARALFFECPPDDPAQCATPDLLKANRARMRFYEELGARPLVNNEYHRPLREGVIGDPVLMIDLLDGGGGTAPSGRGPPGREYVRQVVRAILHRKYQDLCPPEYITRVVDSFRDDPVVIREPRYGRRSRPALVPPPIQGAGPPVAAPLAVASAPTVSRRLRAPVALAYSDQHSIHHVRERGYVESPVRIRSILSELEPTGLFERAPTRRYPERHIKAVHDAGYFEYLERVCASIPAGKSVYPYVFPLRNPARPPKDLSVRAGYYCIDTFTPLNANAFLAARGAVDCALAAADAILAGRRRAYALVRPPGHHAERRAFGGFCYFNNAAIAAQYLAPYGRVAILDVDYHHGNGQQDIFYERADVLTVSIHGHPNFAYPYFTGFADERGAGAGLGFNVNFPLPEQQTGEQYLTVLARALRVVERFRPTYVVIALGFDLARRDPTGTWSLSAKDFYLIGRALAAGGWPLLVIQEGGYRTRTLGVNARHFFEGLVTGLP
jgi:acetoin utilization deacetylase AcuC-like enzyme/GNAT superfamily N-acetyltransferase